MIKSKGLATVMVIAASVLALSACGKSKDSSSSSNSTGSISSTAAMKNYKAGEQFKATKDLDVSVLYSDQPNYPFNKNWDFLKQVTKKTNVTLKTTIAPASDYTQKRSLLISSGDAPTVIMKTYPGEENSFIASKTILPVSDYVKYMPNFEKKVKEWKLQPDLDTIRQSDGKYYVLPGVHEEIWPDYSIVIRTDLFKKYNISIPTTWDELGDAFAKLHKADPSVIPFSDRFTGNSLLNIMAPTYGTSAGWGLGTAASYDWDKKQYVYAPFSSGYKKMVETLHDWVKDGLLDKESFSQQDDQAQTKFVSGQSAAISGNAQNVIDYKTAMDENLGKGKYSIAKISVPGGPEGKLMGGTRLECGLMINSNIKKNKNFKAILQFIDWLWYSDEGQQFAKWGVEGETYTKTGSKYNLAKDINFLGLNPSGTKDLRKDYGYSVGNFSYGGSTELLHSTMQADELKFQNDMSKTHKQAKVAPIAPLAQEDQQQATLLSTPLADYTNSNTFKFITGERSISEYKDFLKELKAKGSDRYIKMINKAATQYKDKYGD